MERGPAFEQYAQMERPNAENDNDGAIETMPYRELQELVVTKLTAVNEALNTERDLAAQVRKMGAGVSRETAEGIMRLEDQKNALLAAAKEYLEPVSRDANMAAAMGEVFLVVRPENFDELMTDPGEMVVTDDMITIVGETEELSKEETALVAQSTQIEAQMKSTLAMMGNLERKQELIPTSGSVEKQKETLASMQEYLQGSLRALEDVDAKLAEVRSILSLGLPQEQQKQAA